MTDRRSPTDRQTDISALTIPVLALVKSMHNGVGNLANPLISGTGKATDFKFGGYIYMAIPNKTPNLEEGEAIGVGDGTVRKSVGEFL